MLCILSGGDIRDVVAHAHVRCTFVFNWSQCSAELDLRMVVDWSRIWLMEATAGS